MRWEVHRIGYIYLFYVSEHTAYSKSPRRPPLCISLGNHREWREKPEEPPPARAVPQSRFLNANQAADYSQPCEVGRSFCFFEIHPRCRSPPNKPASVTRYTNLFGNVVYI